MTKMGSTADLYTNVIIEIRPRLQSVNVFLNLKTALRGAQVLLTNNEIIIRDIRLSYTLPCKSIEILPESLSCLQITDKNITFRFATTNKDTFGSFRAEILQLRNDNLLYDQTTFLNKNSSYDLSCVNCSQVFCKDIKFDRILPLPSDHAEPSDWFCHAHSSNGNEKLDPKLRELFYSKCFAHVNLKLLNGVLKKTTNIICKRCMSWLGLVVNEICYKIWFNTVCFTSEIGSHETDTLCDTYKTIRAVLRESFLSSMKIILQCQVSKDQTDHVLLWIIEKRLNILTDSAEEGFKNSFVAKVLFKFHSGWNNDVNQWMSDDTISNLNISKPMMIALLKHLYQMNKKLPQDCSVSNDFYISYLALYSDE